MTIDNKNITMSVIDEGVLIVITKGAKPQEVLWIQYPLPVPNSYPTILTERTLFDTLAFRCCSIC